jgi:hypothetical protein
MVSRPYVNWKIPTGLEISEYGELTYTPGISATFNHGFPDWPLHDFRRGPFMNLSHNLGFNRINWIGNFRKGLDAAFNNSYNFDFHRLANNKEALSIDYSVSGIGHFIITEGFGLSTYARFRHWFYHDPDYHDQAGDALRGVLDKAVHAEYMLSLNLDFPIRILRFLPSQWFNTAKLRFFDFEMHLSPIIDMAFYKSPPTGNPLPETSRITFDNNNILISGGLEVIVFPGFMRSLYIRVSAAWNFLEQINNPGAYYLNPILPIVPHLPAGDNREIFIGIGHHY